METMAPKWGDEAAEYRWKMTRIQLAGLPLALIAGAAILLRSEQAVAWVLLAAFVILAVPLTVMGIIYLRRMNRAASKTLGVKVTWKADSSPPPKSPAYEKWCEQNGLVPYGASRAFGKARPG